MRIHHLVFSYGLLVAMTGSSLWAESIAPVESSAAVEAIPTALQDYVTKADEHFSWKLLETTESPNGTIYYVELISQNWQDIVWEHSLIVFEPKEVKHENHLLLFINGGTTGKNPRADQMMLGHVLSSMMGARCAFLLHVPNQPLMGGKNEDDLISETFLRYLATEDPSWPLLFPMVKSATRAMDALEELAEQEWKQPVDGFVVTGASKRGWTSWLTAAVDDRVKGVAPIVIDMLNLQPQMKYQITTWGKYSEQIQDYTSKGLVQTIDTQPEIPLWDWVDPYTYRDVLTLPKLIINGTNDRYWVVDALNLYWDGLKGTKHIRYVPNAGHNLKGGQEGALATLSAFFRLTAIGQELPEIAWVHDEQSGDYRLTIESTTAPKSARLWKASSETKDFRNSKWTATPLTADESGKFVGVVTPLENGHVALYGELTFQQGDLEYTLSTQLRRE